MPAIEAAWLLYDELELDELELDELELDELELVPDVACERFSEVDICIIK